MEPARDYSVDHASRYRRLRAWIYVMWRVVAVLVYAPATFEGRRRYRRPGLAAAALLLLAGETTWSALRLWRRRGDPRRIAWLDTATTATIAVAFPAAVGPDTTNAWHAWGATNTPVQAEVVSLLLERNRDRVAAIVLLSAAPVLGSLLCPDRTHSSQATRTAVVTLFRGLWGSLYSDFMRANVARLDEAHVDAVATSKVAAHQRARARHRRYLQDSALGVLDSVSRSQHPRDPDLRRAAVREAARLRTMLMPADSHPELSEIVEVVAGHGVDVEIVPGRLPRPVPHHTVAALSAELVAALADRGSDDTTVRNLVLFVDTVDNHLVATLHGDAARREIRLEL
ncbi:MAG: hypothetical protein K1X95_11485 [Acidimicrobiia bacterium]|nr:hypothetical protein [Acidimicrobiia bacterium]